MTVGAAPLKGTSRDGTAGTGDPLLSVRNLRVEFGVADNARITAVNDVSFDLAEGTTMAVVGESGCGKTTLARALMHLNRPTSGEVRYAGTDLSGLDEKRFRVWRKDLQMVFQDPYGSLDPHMRLDDLVSEPLRVHERMSRSRRRARAVELLGTVGLNPELASRRPHQLSGGQRQRVGIARALALQPKLLVCDEPTSALDVSVQAQVLALLSDLQQRLGTTMLFISHSLGVVRHISDRVAIMYLGRIVETGPTAQIFAAPAHPYTKALLHVIPDPGRPGGKQRRAVLQGELPSVANPPSGCPFRTRCPLAIDRCAAEMPPTTDLGEGHLTACWRSADVAAWDPASGTVPVAHA